MKNIIYIFSLLLIVSCGTRKVNKLETSIVTEVKDTTEIKVNTGSTEVKTTETEKHETENVAWNETTGTITPIEPDKPMAVTDKAGNKTTFENATLNFGKNTGTAARDTTEKTVENTVKKDTLAGSKNTGHQAISETKTDTKNTVSEKSYWWLWLLIPAAITIYLMLNRKKSA